MQLVLSIPFRTKINLHPHFVVRRTARFVETLNKVAETLNESKKILITALSQHDENLNGLYKSIDEDIIPPSTLPLFSVIWPPSELDIISINPPPGINVVKIQKATLSYFDHTVAILELQLHLDELNNGKIFAESLDYWSFSLATEWMAKSREASIAIEQGLLNAETTKHPICATIEADNAYYDRHYSEQQSTQRDLLWVSRVLYLDSESSDIDWLRYWTQDQLDKEIRVQIGDFDAALRVGNSVVFGRPNEVGETAISRALLLCNRFYAIAHVLSSNQRLVHVRLLGEEVSAEKTKTINDAIRSRLDLIHHEYEDTMLGVQGSRSLAIRTYMSAWGFEKLISTTARRLASVDSLVQAAMQRRSLRYTRLVEATLTMIGGLTLLDFAVNLLNFARTPGLATDSWFGLVDIAQIISEDVLLNFLLIAIIFAAYKKLRRR